MTVAVMGSMTARSWNWSGSRKGPIGNPNADQANRGTTRDPWWYWVWDQRNYGACSGGVVLWWPSPSQFSDGSSGIWSRAAGSLWRKDSEWKLLVLLILIMRRLVSRQVQGRWFHHLERRLTIKLRSMKSLAGVPLYYVVRDDLPATHNMFFFGRESYS